MVLEKSPQIGDTRDVFARLLPTGEESRDHLIQLGVPQHRLPSDVHEIDLVALICSLDRLFASGCGHGGVKWFLHHPDPDLGGRAPKDLILEPNGIERIHRVVARELELARS